MVIIVRIAEGIWRWAADTGELWPGVGAMVGGGAVVGGGTLGMRKFFQGNVESDL